MTIEMSYCYFDEILSLPNCSRIVIQRNNVFSKLIQDVYLETENLKFKLKNEIAMPQNLLVISDIWHFDANTTTIIKSIHRDILSEIEADVEQHMWFNTQILNITDQLSHYVLEHDLNLTMKSIEVSDLPKIFSVKIETNANTLVEKMYDLINIVKYQSKIKLLILFNCSDYFSPEEYNYIVEYIALNQINVLFIDANLSNKHADYLIDSDLCIFKNVTIQN